MRVRASIVITLLAAAGAAVAAPPSEGERQARKAYRLAEQHFKAGLYAEALAQYQAGYEAHPLPGFLVNIAQCQRRLGDLRKAQGTYRKFLMVAPDSPHAPEVTALVAELDELIADLDAEEAAPSVPTSAPSAERAPALSLPPPSPVPRAIPPREPPQGVAMAMAAPAGEPPATPGRRRWWLWTVAGVGVAAAATAAVLVLGAPGTTTVHDGSLGTLRR